MISQSSYTSIIMMIAIGLILPIGLAAWWLIRKKEKLGTVLAGAATWFVFAIVLESIPKAILMNPSNAIGKAITGSPALTILVAALLAGLFEETGRLLVFKTVLKKRSNKETAISYGIGHGGFEALYLLVLSGVQNLMFASMINSGTFQDYINAAAAQGADISALEVIPESLKSLTPLTVCISGFERVFAILLHIGLSILVFYAVKRSKTGFYFLAVLLHALFDVPAALYQLGIIKNVLIVEALLAVYAIIFFAVALKKLYDKDSCDTEGNC